MINTKIRQNFRIIWAITAKDIVDGIKNKTTLSVIITTLFVVVFYKFLPSLEKGDALPKVMIYNEGNSSIVPMLENSSSFHFIEFPSQERMERYLANRDVPELGLVIPPDFDQAWEGSELPEN
jgi:hypothetical protein